MFVQLASHLLPEFGARGHGGSSSVSTPGCWIPHLLLAKLVESRWIRIFFLVKVAVRSPTFLLVLVFRSSLMLMFLKPPCLQRWWWWRQDVSWSWTWSFRTGCCNSKFRGQSTAGLLDVEAWGYWSGTTRLKWQPSLKLYYWLLGNAYQPDKAHNRSKNCILYTPRLHDLLRPLPLHVHPFIVQYAL